MKLGEILDRLDLFKGDLIVKDKDANVLYNSRVWNDKIKDRDRDVIRIYCDFESRVYYLIVE
jgi:hypothetical protein